ncbi:MAG: PHP-associated domain-containing protein [Desulfobacterales bacterium]|nr:PHP-associated domain-containing protein [Desulfobacterales bacterium]
MLRALRCDLHIHTCLSPCAELDMFPRAIIEKSIAEKLDVIAVCDHNASENAAHVIKLSGGKPISVLPGMEITTLEEVHLLALFDDLESLYGLQGVIYDHLPGVNQEEIFGCQAIVNAQDEVEGMNGHLLIGSADLPLQDVIDLVHSLGGLAVASHIDRPSYSVISQLGFIDPSMQFDALEISHAMGIKRARRQYPELASFAMITSSDAHVIRDVGRACTTIFLKEGNVRELRLAFQNRDGRYIETT